MKPTLTLLVFLSCLACKAQDSIIFSEPIPVTARFKLNSQFKKGENGEILGTFNKSTAVKVLLRTSNNQLFDLPYESFSKTYVTKPVSVRNIWDKQMLSTGIYKNLLTKGYQYTYRNFLNEEALSYMGTLRQEKRLFEDDLLEDYLYTLVIKIHPGLLHDRRAGNLSVKVAKDNEPNAFMLPNGCMIVSSGLLAMIDSEDELVGILTHEIAHFVLDHPVMNYNKAITDQKRAAFWSGFATVIAAGADVYLASTNKNHVPGILTYSTAVVASTIADNVRIRMGIKYNQNQELEADSLATLVLTYLNYNNAGLCFALTKLKDHCTVKGETLALVGSSTHPSLNKRIDL